MSTFSDGASLTRLPPPDVLRTRAVRSASAPPTSRVQQRGLGQLAEDVYAQVDQIERESGPFAADIMGAFYEAEFRSMGFPVTIKSSAEREILGRERALKLRELEKQESINRVENVSAFLLELRGAPAEQIIPGAKGSALTLEQYVGLGPLDQSLFDDPERFVAVTRALAQATGDPSIGLSMLDMMRFEPTKQAAVASPGERGAKQLAQQESASRDFEQQAGRVAQVTEGDEASPLVAALKATLESAGQAVDQDLTPGLFGDDLDEARGSAAAAKGILALGRQFAQAGLPAQDILLGILAGDTVGKRIQDVLAGGDVVADPETGLRLLAAGEGGESEAIRNYMALVDEMSALFAMPRRDILARLGAGYDDFVPEDLGRARSLFGGAAE